MWGDSWMIEVKLFSGKKENDFIWRTMSKSLEISWDSECGVKQVNKENFGKDWFAGLKITYKILCFLGKYNQNTFGLKMTVNLSKYWQN